MPATSIWDGSVWQPIQGLEGADGTDGQDGATGPQGDKGDQGDTGPPGPSSVSTDAGNQSTLGSDSLIYTPDFAAGTYLPLGGGTMSGIIDMGNNDINFVKRLLGASDNHLQLQASAGFAMQIKDSAGFIVYQVQDNNNITVAASSTGTAKLQWRNDLSVMRMFTTLDMQANQIVEVNEITGPVAGSLIIDGANPTFGITFQVDNGLVMNLDGSRLQMNVDLDMNGLAIIAAQIISFKINGTTELTLRPTSFQVPNVWNSTTTSPASVNVDATGAMQRSTATLAATDAAGVVAMDARTGLTSGESIDLKALTDYILDRIDALEAFH